MLQIITTQDGSHSIKSDIIDDTYHSIYGSLNESNLVYIENGFCEVVKNRTIDVVNILEIGFGTGLNCFLTLQKSIEKSVKVNYFAVEPHPIDKEIYELLNYPLFWNNKNSQLFFDKLHSCTWEKEVEIDKNFKIIKLINKVQNIELPDNHFHLIYFDAFAPDKQLDVWNFGVLKKIYNSTQINGIFSTYSTKGEVKRNLKSCGFSISKLPGPIGKREVLRGLKLK